MNKNIKISIIGSRGIPARYGGFETFAEEISKILVRNGYHINVQCDPGTRNQPLYEGVNLIFSSKPKSSGRIRYYYEGIRNGLKNSDIIIVLGSGGSVFYLLNVIKRKIIITNPDGIEYKRAKWPFYVKLYWRISELFAVLLSDYIVADSAAIGDYLRRKYRITEKRLRIIEYGAYLNNRFDKGVLEKYNLRHKGYYLTVARIEPENNIHHIIKAFLSSGSEHKLAIAGNYKDNLYGRRLYDKFASDRIIFTGGIYDKYELAAIRFSCRAYFHGHTVGGTNPSLLEAMANGNTILCHDNIFNREVTAGTQFYFTGVDDCTRRICEIDLMNDADLSSYGMVARKRVEEYYNWTRIGDKYLDFLASFIK